MFYLVWLPKKGYILRLRFLGLAGFLDPLLPCSEAKEVPLSIVCTAEDYKERQMLTELLLQVYQHNKIARHRDRQ